MCHIPKQKVRGFRAGGTQSESKSGRRERKGWRKQEGRRVGRRVGQKEREQEGRQGRR